MPIILQVLQDPTDIVIQGYQITGELLPIPPSSPYPVVTTGALFSLLEGQQIFAEIPIAPIPNLMIGQTDWYGVLPRKIGPMVMLSDGTMIMLTIGANPINMIIDPIQLFINSTMILDSIGAFQDLNGDLLLGSTTPDFYETTFEMCASIDQSALMYPFAQTLPRDEIAKSGSIKNITAPIVGITMGQHLMEYYCETSQKFLITGVTRDSAGNALGNCRVVVLQTNKITNNIDQYANPYIAETTSDGSGNFSIQVGKNENYQLISYLSGSPDVAGVTINTITPITG